MWKDFFKNHKESESKQGERFVFTAEPESTQKTARKAVKLPTFSLKNLLIPLLILAILFVLSRSVFIVSEGQFGFVEQFGRIVRIIETPGIKFITPFVQSHFTLDKRLQVYDVSPSEVLTADKKAMIVDSYALWRIADVREFIRTVGSIPEFERRLDAACFSVIKNVMGQLQQTELISDEDSRRKTLNDRVSLLVNENMKNYGIDVSRVEIRRYDLPMDNLSAVYDRMISERSQIAGQYEAEGRYEAAKIRNVSDREAEIIVAEAEASAERIKGEGEAQYIATLGDIYRQRDQADFYRLLLELESLKKSMAQGGTVILDEDSLLGQFLKDHADE